MTQPQTQPQAAAPAAAGTQLFGDVTSPTSPEGHHVHVDFKLIMTIYVALLGLMLLTFGVAYIDLGRFNFGVAMAIALAKMTLILMFFMHVKYSDRLVWVYSTAAFLWLLILIGGTMNDFLNRGFLNVPGK